MTSLVATAAQSLKGSAPDLSAQQWETLLTPDMLQQTLQQAISSLPQDAATDPAVGGINGGAAQVSRESTARLYAATASVLGYLAQKDPNSSNALFFTNSAPWQEQLVTISPFTGFSDLIVQAVLSPVGLLHIYRQYFFELNSFLGPASGHVWLSPGGTVELVEVNIRKTLVERTTEVSQEITTKSELATTTQDELSDAVKQENSENIKFGASASGGFNVLVAHGEASATFNLDTSRKTASETTHKQTRQQSEKLSSEIRRNYKTTFRTVTEVTDTSSRRYVLQNTTDKLVNYELRRKMREVGVQLQHISTQLCWQYYVDNPGNYLAISNLVHVAKPEDAEPSQPPPDAPAPLANEEVNYNANFQFIVDTAKSKNPGHSNAPNTTYINGVSYDDFGNVTNEIVIVYEQSFAYKPPVGKQLQSVAAAGTPIQKIDPSKDAPNPFEFQILPLSAQDQKDGKFTIRATHVNFRRQPYVPIAVKLIFAETDDNYKVRQQAYDQKQGEYTEAKARAQHEAFVKAVRERIKLAGDVKTRVYQDLREEERHVVFRRILEALTQDMGQTDKHITAELIRQLFDVDSMMYFVAPDWWEPNKKYYYGQNFSQPPSTNEPYTLGESDKLGWDGVKGQSLEKYLITEDSKPAPMGASLGWLLQLDGDNLRNAFLNSAWVKAVLPIRPGKEKEALDWLRNHTVEGNKNLNALYQLQENDPQDWQGKTIGEVLDILAQKIKELYEEAKKVNPSTHNLPTETVFEYGFDPLQGGVRVNAEPYEVFDQWIEVLPTDQVVAVEYQAQ